MRFLNLGIGLVVAGLMSASPLHAAVAYDESASPDLSGNGLSPTFLSLVAGSNQIFGATGNPGTGTDRDYFSVTVPSGFLLSQLTLLPGTSVLGNSTFFGVQSGTQVTVTPTAPSASGLLGAMHYTGAQVGTNILPALGLPFAGSTGFTPPLAAGNYAFWLQEIGAGSVPYALDLVVTAVPEPANYAMMMAGLTLIGFAARRTKRRQQNVA
jgi:hypothetical protein